MDEYNFYGYINDKSILVVNNKNTLIRMKCPFAVTDKYNRISVVESVIDKKGIICFRINGRYQIHSNFKISAKS